MLAPEDYPRLSAKTLFRITGYKQPARQLKAMKDQGFFRARLDRFNQVVVESTHYEAVCAGQTRAPAKGGRHDAEPRLASETQ